MGIDPLDALRDLVGDLVGDLRVLSVASTASHLALVVVVIMGLAEIGWLATRRHGSDRSRLFGETATAAVLGMGGLIAGLGLAGLFVVAFDLVGRLAPGAATRLWAEQPVLGFAAAFVAWDFVGHLYHRIGHGTVLGWAAHRPHHTGTEFALSLAWRQSWLPVHAIVLPLVAIGGWSLSTIVICAAISNVLQAAQHSSAGLNYPAWLVAILMTPQQHRRHHHRTRRRDGREPDREATAVNLGPVLTIWDRIAGSYDPTPVPPDTDYGVGSTTVNPVRLQFEGWTELVALRHNPPTPRRSRDVHPERMPTASTSPAGVAPPG